MSSDESSGVDCRGLGKRYEIYKNPQDRLKQFISNGLRRAIGTAPRDFFDEFWALKDLTLSIRPGETVGIIGSNGSGKSTLLQLICGTLSPTTGLVTTKGRIAALLELGAGFNPEFTGAENVRLSALLYGLSNDEIEERFEAIVSFADIGDFIGQPVKTYSSGMYVRLAFAIAANVRADILVIDEALSVGDARFSQKCMRYIKSFQDTGTVLFVSHDVGAVINLCSRAVWLDQGHCRTDGLPKDVVEAYLAEQHAQDRASIGASVRFTRSKAGSVKTHGEIESRPTATPRQQISPRNVKYAVVEFDPDSAAGELGAGLLTITSASIGSVITGEGRSFFGGEEVELRMEAVTNSDVREVIFGFYVKDHLGQRLFGDNSFERYRDEPVLASVGQKLTGRFVFRMPVLRSGRYTIDVAVATGTQLDHTQQHWIYDAITFQCHESTMKIGMIAIPMETIEILRME